MGEYKPPFHITNEMMNLIAEISEQVGRITVQGKVSVKCLSNIRDDA